MLFRAAVAGGSVVNLKRGLYQRTQRIQGQALYNSHLPLAPNFPQMLPKAQSLTSAVDEVLVPCLSSIERHFTIKQNKHGARMVINAMIATGIFDHFNTMLDFGIRVPGFDKTCPRRGSTKPDYIALHVDTDTSQAAQEVAGDLAKTRDLQSLRPFKNICVLDVKRWTEPKKSQAYFNRHLPKITSKMHALASHLEMERMRGVLSTGYSWQFIALERETGKPGATYFHSLPLEMDLCLLSDTESKDGKYPPALIVNILYDWMVNSSQDVRKNQYLRLSGPLDC